MKTHNHFPVSNTSLIRLLCSDLFTDVKTERSRVNSQACPQLITGGNCHTASRQKRRSGMYIVSVLARVRARNLLP